MRRFAAERCATAHFKPAYPDRDDVNFLKATIARYDAASDSAQISYEQVDTSLIAPRVRNYGRKSEKVAASPQPAARA